MYKREIIHRQQHRATRMKHSPLQIYIIGGSDGAVRSSSVYSFDTISRQLTQEANIQTRRTRAFGATYDGKIFLAGGYLEDYLCSVEIYDPEKKSWTFGPSLKHARADGALFVFQNELYAIGGYNGNKYVAEIERYNPNSKCWEIYDRMPKPRAGFGIATYKGKIAIAGGWDSATNSLNTVICYDTVNKEWTIMPSMCEPRKMPTLVTTNENGEELLVVAGGYKERWTAIESIERYDSQERTWYMKDLGSFV
ncbi:hypothetical protein WR25_24532 [Diploscapter pachys]|uniref:Kelch repeat protein n=1 Tax=Diploscapter pachys TaxID=2018661 RepID=A0A2A2JR82_9BILA|nr:hypothetical protein WR25_24532 [Diploscapter pachys]